MSRLGDLEKRVKALEDEVYYPTSGRPVFDPNARVSDLPEGPYGYGSQDR